MLQWHLLERKIKENILSLGKEACMSLLERKANACEHITMNTESLIQALQERDFVDPEQVSTNMKTVTFNWEDSHVGKGLPKETLSLYTLNIQAEVIITGLSQREADFHKLLGKVGLWANTLEQGRLLSLERKDEGTENTEVIFQVESLLTARYETCEEDESELFHREKHWKLGVGAPFTIKSIHSVTTSFESRNGHTV